MSRLNQIFMPRQNEAVTHAFDRLALPMPEEGEFVNVHNDAKMRPGGLVFHPAGLVIRATTGEKTVSHGLVVPLIGTAYDEPETDRNRPRPGQPDLRLRISAFAGLPNTPVNKEHVRWLTDVLENDRIIWGDPDPSNVKLLPVTSHDFPKGIPVVADPDFLQCRQAGLPLSGRPHSGPQGYGQHGLAALRAVGANKTEAEQWVQGITQLQTSWNGMAAHPDNATKFWSEALSLTRGHTGSAPCAILSRGWEDIKDPKPGSKQERVLVAGQKYKARLASRGMAV